MPRLSPPRKRGAVSYGDVTSANVVGYQLIPIPAVDYVLFTPTFKGISGDLDLTTIEICDADGNILEDLANEITLQVMDETGTYTDLYGYCPGYGGWNLDWTLVEKGEVTIPVGRAFCVGNSYGEGAYFRVSGEVDLKNMNKIDNVDYVLWGNSTPVAIDLTQVSVVDAEGNIYEDMANEVTVQVMDETGTYTDLYGYCPGYGGWNLDWTLIEKGDVVIQPGEAFCVGNSFGDEVYFKLPSPVKE